MLDLLLIYLHVMTMFVAVALSLGGTIFYVLAARTGRTEALRSIGAFGRPATRFIPVLFIIGGIFGLITAIYLKYNLLAPWLIIAYVLFAALAVSGGALSGPTAERIGKIVEPAPDGALPAETLPLIRRFYFTSAIEVIFLVLIVFDMVVKPFG